jgi:hypothetical protein
VSIPRLYCANRAASCGQGSGCDIGWTVRRSVSGRGRMERLALGPSSLLFKGFPGGKAAGA